MRLFRSGTHRERPKSPRLKKAIAHCWSKLVDSHFQLELNALPPGQRGKNVGNYLRIGWVVLTDSTLNDNFHLDRFSTHEDGEPQSDKPKFRAVLKRENGLWVIPRDMLNDLRNHPALQLLAAEDRYFAKKRTSEEEVLAMADLARGTASTAGGERWVHPGAGDILLDAIRRPIAPTWLREGREARMFWDILWKAVKLGIEIGRDDIAKGASAIIRQGASMSGTGSSPDLLSQRIQGLLEAMHASGAGAPTPGKVLTMSGLSKPKLSDADPITCSTDPAFNRWLASNEITFSKFRDRVKHYRKNIWGN